MQDKIFFGDPIAATILATAGMPIAKNSAQVQSQICSMTPTRHFWLHPWIPAWVLEGNHRDWKRDSEPEQKRNKTTFGLHKGGINVQLHGLIHLLDAHLGNVVHKERGRIQPQIQPNSSQSNCLIDLLFMKLELLGQLWSLLASYSTRF